jgi:oligoribonuclease NrnB/cAMP/cGMP phosphodiesterase (DHH superfamily)
LAGQLVLYHKSCYDGFASAWVLKRNHWPDAEYYPIQYSDPVPWEKIKGADVIFVDFSLKRPEMERAIGMASSCLVLDHHKSAQAELEGLPNCTFNMEKCGARLAWEYVADDAPPWVINYIEDRDLWTFKEPFSREITMGIRSYPMDFEVWDRLAERTPASLQDEGEAILRFQDQYIEAAKGFCRFIKRLDYEPFYNYTIPIVNAPYFGISDLLNAILEHEATKEDSSPVAIAWFHRVDGKYQYSLRSIGNVDVSEFARKYGGGGHRNAAGFEHDRLLW